MLPKLALNSLYRDRTHILRPWIPEQLRLQAMCPKAQIGRKYISDNVSLLVHTDTQSGLNLCLVFPTSWLISPRAENWLTQICQRSRTNLFEGKWWLR